MWHIGKITSHFSYKTFTLKNEPPSRGSSDGPVAFACPLRIGHLLDRRLVHVEFHLHEFLGPLSYKPPLTLLAPPVRCDT